MSENTTKTATTFKIDDRISEAYYGDMGESFARQVQDRIHWLTSQVVGQSILDVGCSQGISAILLGREGHQVLGLDISETAIVRAQAYLSDESNAVRENVAFLQDDFLRVDLENGAYTTIVMGEVLEHLVRPENFISRAHQLLSQNGRLVVSVPFGINDFPDHKKTFYLTDILQLLHSYFEVKQVKHFGRWIGYVAEKRDIVLAQDDVLNQLRLSDVIALENAMFGIERDLTDQIAALQLKVEDAHGGADEYDALRERLSSLQDELYARALKVDTQAEQIQNLQSNHDSRVTDITLLGLGIAGLETDIRALRIEAEMATKRANSLEVQLKRLRSSTSWRLTAPLRMLILMLRGRKKK